MVKNNFENSFGKAKKVILAGVSSLMLNHSAAQDAKLPETNKSITKTESASEKHTTTVVKNKDDIRYQNRKDFEVLIHAQDSMKALYNETWEKLKLYPDFKNLVSTINNNFKIQFKNQAERNHFLDNGKKIYSGDRLETMKGSDYDPSIFLLLGVQGDFGGYTPPNELAAEYNALVANFTEMDRKITKELKAAEDSLRSRDALPEYEGCIGCMTTYKAPVFKEEIPPVEVLDYQFSRERQAQESGSSSFPDKSKSLTDYYDKNGKLIKTM